MQLPPFQLERYFAQYEFTTRYMLGSSDCESMKVGDLLELETEASEKLQNLWLGYTESPGALSLRQEICDLYTTIEPEQVLVHSGAEEAIFLLMQAILKPGEHAIVHWPCYQSLAEVARGIGCQVTPWIAREENGWALDLDELKRAIQPATRLVVINLPHNPTGYLMPKETFLEVNRIVQENDLVLFSDEVYRESEYSPEDRLPAACDLNPTAVSLGVTSKTYGLPGLRIGWIATQNGELYDRMAGLKDYTTICNSAPSEFLAELGLRHRGYLARRSVELIRNNLALADAFFDRQANRFKWIRPKAGPIAFPKLLGEDVDAFCRELVIQANVLLLPGSLYEDQGNHFRIGLGRANFPEALGRLEEFLDH